MSLDILIISEPATFGRQSISKTKWRIWIWRKDNQDNLRTDDIEKEEYLETKGELILLINHARHILNMNDNNPNALKWIKNVKQNWNGIQKMVGEIENYYNKRTFQEI